MRVTVGYMRGMWIETRIPSNEGVERRWVEESLVFHTGLLAKDCSLGLGGLRWPGWPARTLGGLRWPVLVLGGLCWPDSGAFAGAGAMQVRITIQLIYNYLLILSNVVTSVMGLERRSANRQISEYEREVAKEDREQVIPGSHPPFLQERLRVENCL